MAFPAAVSSAPEKSSAVSRIRGAVKAAAGALSQKWARRYSTGTILYATALVLAIWGVITVASVAHRSGRQLQEATQSVAHIREVLEKLAGVSASLSEVESSARSFAISGKQSHLTPFYTAAKRVPEQLIELKLLLRYNPGALQSVTLLEPVITRHLKVMNDLVELGNRNLFRGFSQRGLTDEGNTLMKQIHDSLAILEKEHRRRLEQEQSWMAATAERVTMLGVAGIALAGALALVCGAGVLRAMHGRARAEEKLDRLLGSMPDALVIVNAEGKIVGSNSHAEKLLGYSMGELQGENMALLVPERFRQAQRQYYAAYFSQRTGRAPVTTMELSGLHKNGREFPIELSTKPLASEKGLVVTSAIRDITERKRVEEQISKLNKELAARALELETANKEL